jgi:hypothetical protein
MKGETEEYFLYNRTLEPDTYYHVNSVLLIMQDPEYMDRKVALIDLPIQNSFNV